MKRKIILIIAVLIAISFTACKNKTGKSENNTSDNSSTVSNIEKNAVSDDKTNSDFVTAAESTESETATSKTSSSEKADVSSNNSKVTVIEVPDLGEVEIIETPKNETVLDENKYASDKINSSTGKDKTADNSDEVKWTNGYY